MHVFGKKLGVTLRRGERRIGAKFLYGGLWSQYRSGENGLDFPVFFPFLGNF
jgi:hypothetical protein